MDEEGSFLGRLVAWAQDRPGLEAIALVGSRARGEAGADSDVDLILIHSNPEALLENTDWVAAFGVPSSVEKEDWGKVTSLRVFYQEGLEVEYGVADPDWASNPMDAGDSSVIRSGLIVLYERDRHLTRKLLRFGEE
ncbi:MAG: nucleotidyltransferase domain-containing protein [Anaerolineales bacterium]|jgi:predicted nucleotidyltransferase